MKTYKFKTNISCGGCVRAVTPQLEQLPGVENWEVDTDHQDKYLTVSSTHQSTEAIVQAVKKAGFSAEIITDN